MPIKIPDPHGMISRVRSKLQRNCSVRLSPYCDHIIAMRLQGVPYDTVEKWLAQQGENEQFKIPKPTLWRNLQDAKKEIELPLAEELAERWGGSIDIDAVRELQRALLIQRRRIDAMVRQEEMKRKTAPSYFDKRIRAEIETLNGLVVNYFKLMKNPIEAADERSKADAKAAEGDVRVNQEDEKAITDLILRGGLTVVHNDPNSVH